MNLILILVFREWLRPTDEIFSFFQENHENPPKLISLPSSVEGDYFQRIIPVITPTFVDIS